MEDRTQEMSATAAEARVAHPAAQPDGQSPASKGKAAVIWLGLTCSMGWIYLMGTIDQAFFGVVGGAMVAVFIVGLQAQAEAEGREEARKWFRRYQEERALRHGNVSRMDESHTTHPPIY